MTNHLTALKKRRKKFLINMTCPMRLQEKEKFLTMKKPLNTLKITLHKILKRLFILQDTSFSIRKE
nr:unnamed protein product [Callosobruchus analis]